MSREQPSPSGDSEAASSRNDSQGASPGGTNEARTERGAQHISAEGPLLDRTAIEAAFRRLGDGLARRGVIADLYVFDGAAMALAYDARRVTRDIDALFTPHGVVIEEANAVAAELGLPRWWLNEQASVYVAPGGDATARRIFDHPGLRVSAASPEHLLAMKVLAGRRRDAEDIHLLVTHLGLRTVEEILTLCAEIFPDEDVPKRARLLLENTVSGT